MAIANIGRTCGPFSLRRCDTRVRLERFKNYALLPGGAESGVHGGGVRNGGEEVQHRLDGASPKTDPRKPKPPKHAPAHLSHYGRNEIV